MGVLFEAWKSRDEASDGQEEGESTRFRREVYEVIGSDRRCDIEH